MRISRVVARPMLSSIFVVGGIDAMRHPERKVEAAETVVAPLTEQVPALPSDTTTLIRVNAAVQIGAGVLLATGKLRRIAALALIGSIIPTTYAGHRFWEETDEASRAQQLVHFLKNLGLLGGLILAAADNEGASSAGWRAARQPNRLRVLVPGRRCRGRESKRAKVLGKKASRAVGRASRAAGEVKAVVEGAAHKAEGAVQRAEGAMHKAEGAVERAEEVLRKAEGAIHERADLASTQLSASAARAKGLVAKAHDRLPLG